MFIHEAIKKCCVDHNGEPIDYPRGCITRKNWHTITGPRMGRSRIYPTDTLDGCIFISATTDTKTPGWRPTMADLVADDWIAVDGFGCREIK